MVIFNTAWKFFTSNFANKYISAKFYRKTNFCTANLNVLQLFHRTKNSIMQIPPVYKRHVTIFLHLRMKLYLKLKNDVASPYLVQGLKMLFVAWGGIRLPIH